MGNELVKASNRRALTTRRGTFTLPAVIADEGEKAAERFFTFFTDIIPDANTRAAHLHSSSANSMM